MNLLLLALAGCSGQQSDVASPVAEPLDGSWIGQLVQTPAGFTATVDQDRDAWVALHSNDLQTAAQSEGPAGARARIELAAFHADVARISSQAWRSSVLTWEGRTGLPEGSALTWFAALASVEDEQLEPAARWLELAKSASAPEVAQAAQALGQLDALATVEAGDHLLLQRVVRHRELRASGDFKALLEDAGEPVLEEAADGHTRSFYDPQLHWSLATAYAHTPGPQTGVEALLFSPCLTEADLSAQASAGGPHGAVCAANALSLMGVVSDLGDTDDPERARELVRALDAELDPWRQTRMATADADGQELLRGLRLLDKLRGDMLLALGRKALSVKHPRQALAFAQLAMDLESPRDIGPINSPGLFAVMAEANLQTNHTREALDALQVLSEALPHVSGVDEIVGDLAILQGLDRQGDSKEN